MPSPRPWRALAGAAAGALVLVGCGPGNTEPAASTRQPATSSAQPSWDDATYRTTCDGLVQGNLKATLVDGAARVPVDVSQSPYYQYLDVELQATATGDVDGDGTPDTVVLLQCSPQPSNGAAQEVHVFRADGAELGVLPSASDLQEAATLPPEYVPTGLAVEQEEVVAPMKAYGPDDSHATGPSVPLTVRWRWTGTGFDRVS
ncbi:hypothetical protein [Modestobacter sp. NPDC049651]|uniref:hypothetical protein n=1 Tax=unclassified Modestobacter TaxID=2643866 RepID=UPI0034019AF5